MHSKKKQRLNITLLSGGLALMAMAGGLFILYQVYKKNQTDQNRLESDTVQSFADSGLAGETEADSSPSAAEYHKITAEEAKKMMAESQDYILLDVRTQDEFDESRIDGAILIPDTEIKLRAAEELPDKEGYILVYCRSGRRSAIAANILIEQGYTNVYDFGGIVDWPYSVVQ